MITHIHSSNSNILVSKNGQTIDASFNISLADQNYFSTYQVPVIAGRNFYNNMSNERNSIIINQKAAEAIGFMDPVEALGQKIKVRNTLQEIVGVVKNFHHESLQKELEPYIYQFRHPGEFGYFPSRISVSNIDDAILFANRVWKKHFPNALFDHFFLDEYFNRQYSSYHNLGRLVGISSFLAILIACMGLFALVSYIVNKKIKEIGIRKVNGAKVYEILQMLNGDFLKWVMVAFVIASPIAWFALKKWLDSFAYKTEINWWIFALSGGLTLLTALLTVSWQSYKAASRNPVEALRYE